MMPGRIVPDSGGVTGEPSSITGMTFAELFQIFVLGGVREHDLIAAVLDRFGLRERACGVSCRILRAGAALGRARVAVRSATRSPASRRP